MHYIEVGSGLSPPIMRAVIFDLDGTLQTLEVDFPALRRRLGAILAPLGAGLAEGPVLEGLEEALQAARGSGAADGELEVVKKRAMEEMERAEMEALPRSRVLPHAREAVKELSARGIKTALLSRACRRYVDASAKRIGAPFDAIASRDDSPRYKPDPAPVGHLMKEMGVEARECALVGDHPFDMVAGRRAGTRCAGVLTGFGSREQLIDAGAEAVFDGVGGELVRWILEGVSASTSGAASRSPRASLL